MLPTISTFKGDYACRYNASTHRFTVTFTNIWRGTQTVVYEGTRTMCHRFLEGLKK